MGLLTPGWSLGALTPSALACLSSPDFPLRQAFEGPMTTHTSTGSPERHPVPQPARRELLFLTLQSGRSGARAGLTGTGWWAGHGVGALWGPPRAHPAGGLGVCLQRLPGGRGRPCPQPKPPFRPTGETWGHRGERKKDPGEKGHPRAAWSWEGSEGRPQPAHCPRPPRPPPSGAARPSVNAGLTDKGTAGRWPGP